MIHWHLNMETRHPFGDASPDPKYFEPIGMPDPWRDRPWIFANMVASKNGVVAWKREDATDDPVLEILGRDQHSPERVADLLNMRHLRVFGDMAIGGNTNREQPDLIQTPQEEWEKKVFPELQPVADALYRFRENHGLLHHPRQIIYSPSGRLDLKNAVFNRPDIRVSVITTFDGEKELEERRAKEKKIELIAMEDLSPIGLSRAHKILFDEGVRYLNCEGGETILRELHRAGILDEVFVTYTDAIVDESAHDGILRIFNFEDESAELIAEGKAGTFTFRRWRFNPR